MTKRLAGLMFAAVLFGAQVPVRAQDPLKVAPNMYKLLFENERVRVMKVTFKPGEKIGVHSHPDHYVYVVEGGTLKIFDAKGAPSVAELKADDVLWMGAQTHHAENIGNTKIVLVVNEPKPAAK